jgi:hypothetical protein
VVSASLAEAAVRIALAILLDAAALIIWDIGTRSPARLLADIRAGIHAPASIARGLLRLLTGCAAIAAAATLGVSVVSRSADFTIVESLTLVTALAVEALIGPDLRGQKR